MINKKNILTLFILAVITIVVGVFSIRTLGIKDGGTFAISVGLSLLILILAKDNFKAAIYLFIISLPILVTARKGLYLNLFIIRLNFESIIIILLFLSKYKEIVFNLKRKARDNSYIFKVVLFFVFAGLISNIFAKDPLETFGLTVTSVIVPILLGAIILTIFNRRDVKAITYSLGMAINLSCLYGVVQVLGIGFNLSAIQSSRNLLTFGYHNGNIFVNIALMVFPLLLNYLLHRRTTTLEKIFLVLSLGLQSLSIFLTFSRGAWLALAISCFLILFSKKYKYLFIGVVIVGLVASPFVLPKILGRGNSSTHFLQNTSNTARVLSIVTSKDIMLDNVFGVGYGNFNDYYREQVADSYLNLPYNFRKHMIAPLYSMEHAHNFFLNIGVEMGIIALLSIILIFINRIKASIKNYSLNRGIFISLVIFVFIGLTTGIELNHKGVLTNTYIMWILFAMISVNNEKEDVKYV